MDHTMNQANSDGQDDLFTTATAGLPEVASPDVIRLRDGDRLDLRIGPVRKRLDDAELRMLAYNGSVPGPVLHVDQGSQITVQVRNDGDVEATVHWHGHIAPFRRSGPTFVAMGRFGNVMLINGEAEFSGQAAVGEVVRLYLVNTANTRIFNFAVRGARAKLVGGDSGRYEHETFTGEVLLSPSGRPIDVGQIDNPGQGMH